MVRVIRETEIAVIACFVICACSGGDGPSEDASPSSADGPPQAQDSHVAADGPVGQGADGGLGCCPAGFTMYACEMPDAGAGLGCHNPAMGCASSAVCGQGCDPQVSGRCACVQNELCVVGDHFDVVLCKCVPDQDASAADVRPCVETVLCVMGDHFDSTLCRCVPNNS